MEDLVKVAYEAYAEKPGGKTWDGRDMLPWDDLPKRTRDARDDAAAQAVVRVLR